jgi:hypothetical protein
MPVFREFLPGLLPPYYQHYEEVDGCSSSKAKSYPDRLGRNEEQNPGNHYQQCNACQDHRYIVSFIHAIFRLHGYLNLSQLQI